MDSMRGITFNGAAYVYPDGHQALKGVNLHIPPGQFVVVLGANGSGKTTFAKLVNGLLVPTEGVVSAVGFNTADARNAFEVRSRVGMVFQNPDNQAVASIVEDDVAFGPENLGLTSEEIRRRVTRALGAVGLAGFETRDISTLSGGQKQLVAIAGVLAMEPEVVVFDESGAMLDVAGRERVLQVAHRLHEQGMTIVLITHFIDEALEAQRVVVFDEGSAALDGAPREVLADPEKLRGLGLEPPFEVALDEALGKLGASASPATGSTGLASPSAPCSRHRAQAAPVIAFEDASFSYDGAVPALSNVSFELRRGDILGVIGQTGSGKSTLTQLMNALLQATDGRVVICGLDAAERKRRRTIRAKVGLAFQYPEQQLFAATVAEDVAFGPKNLGLSAAEVERRVRSGLERVGLSYGEFAERSPFALSGGQQRRVALAGILAMEPEVLVLDEPAAGMDPATKRQIIELLESLNADGLTIVIVSHSMDDVAELCTYVLCLEDGKVAMRGTPAELFSAGNAAELERMRLGLPRTCAYALEHGMGQDGLPLTLGALANMLRQS